MCDVCEATGRLDTRWPDFTRATEHTLHDGKAYWVVDGELWWLELSIAAIERGPENVGVIPQCYQVNTVTGGSQKVDLLANS